MCRGCAPPHRRTAWRGTRRQWQAARAAPAAPLQYEGQVLGEHPRLGLRDGAACDPREQRCRGVARN